MGNFWKATDRPDLQEVHLAVIADPGQTADPADVVWLENPPAGAVDGLAILPYGEGVPALAWVTAPPANGVALTDITATWAGGVAPYTGIIFQGSIEENNQTGAQTSITGNIDGVNQPLGAWTWEITDSSTPPQKITGITTITAPALSFATNISAAPVDKYVGDAFGPLTVAGAGGIPPYHYAWKRGSTVIGSDNPTYGPINPVALTNAGNYTCTLTDSRNPAGGAGSSLVSNTQVLNVYALPSFTSVPPATTSVAAGAEFRIQAIGTGGKGTRVYTWYKDGALVAIPDPDPAGPSVYRKTVTTAADAGSYVCRVTDANGKYAETVPCVLTIT